ncbi:serine/threonineeeee-protein kinase ppk6 [Sporothrix schenckii 1099-18]|uniref:Serine/threonineeeee-protein kinase ppk6 n=1 Tax=Sporothrix schenckii 1099-18 TaxID=1397361 RepID=A0A0F2MBF3_SPOSC|nr:serine/threonineeeee-protein kinase ppk6 [Sporothrix schenckii 1099-18]KJR86429.1 serine/threonineeeee-protein kinase ppk6 [Sporothrix schenckii 1099-18]
MSADLFAQFGPFSGGNPPANQQQGQGQTQAQTQTHTGPAAQKSDDPFALLSTAFSQPSSSPVPQQQPQAPVSQSNTPRPQQWSFGAPLQPTQPALNWGSSGAGAWGAPVTSGAPAGEDDEDDDTWGDFEEASTATEAGPPPVVAPPTYQASQPAAPPSQPQEPARTRIVRASTMDLISNTLVNFGDAPVTKSQPPVAEPATSPQPPPRDPWRNPVPVPAPKAKPKPNKLADPNVLFDADDFDVDASFDSDEDYEDDEFGDFETGHASPPRPAMATSSHFSSRPPASSRSSATQQAATPASGTALVDLLSLDEPGPAVMSSSLPVSQPHGTSTQNRSAANLLSPLSFGSTSMTAQANPQAPKSPSFQERNPFPGLAVTTPVSAEFPSETVKNRTPSPVTAWPSLDAPATSAAARKKSAPPPTEDADWDAWGVEGPAPSQAEPGQTKKLPAPTKTQPKPQTKKTTAVPKPTPVTSDWDWDAEEPTQEPDPTTSTAQLPPAIANAAAPSTISDKTPPPTNVPPPSVLLSLFPTLMALPDEALFKPISAQPVEIRNRVIGDPKTIAFLRNYLQIIVVAGRVVAGRKQRWHRDKFLSQSMSISAAGSSKGGGMKLAGLDKAQGQREDREAADVVAAWRRHVGKLRSTVATANAALVAAEAADHKHYPPLKIPELQSATIPVTIAKKVPTSTKPCVICGLKRDERVRGIDGDDVDDIFSEWWVEHWGHRVCKNFWAEHEAALRSR